MDGYTAFGSSIAVDGYKQTLNCPAPAACVADWTVMAAAPQVMTASGYGDLLGKVPAGADWIIADALGAEAIDDYVWGLVQGPLRASLAKPEALAAGDVPATGELAEGLVMSGLAMQAHESSRPASGAEHQFSHLWEMEGHGVDIKPRRLSHGFKVAVGSVAKPWPCTNASSSATSPTSTWTRQWPPTPTPRRWRPLARRPPAAPGRRGRGADDGQAPDARATARTSRTAQVVVADPVACCRSS